jgi:fibronectin type 3 domain-containing protein
LNEEGPSLAPGPYSPEIRVRVEDLAPPRPIGYLDAAADARGVRLHWENLSQEEKLAGYRVYRRLVTETTFRPIGGLLQGNVYLDPEVQPGETAYYQVTAVDDSPAANESRPSPVASVLAAPLEDEPVRPEAIDPGL